MKTRYYRKASTRRAIASFYRMIYKMGRIVKVTGKYTPKRDYRVTFTNENGDRYQYRGFAFWYGGEGPGGLCECLKLIGVPFDLRQQLKRHFHSGPDNFNPNSFIIHVGKDYQWLPAESEFERKYNERIRPQRELAYAFCDDWLIFARDERGGLWYVSTELWHNWADIKGWEDKAFEEKAIERYMLPVAFRNWDRLSWTHEEDVAKLDWIARYNIGKN